MSNEWESELTPSMVQDGLYREIAEVIGVTNLLNLCALVGGSTFYLPKRDRILLPLRDMKICEEFKGYNAMEVSRKYGVSERWVREITNKKL